MELPAQPARCDSHSFGSATGGTTFFVNLTIGAGRARRQIRLAMSPEVTAETFAYAAEACGWEEMTDEAVLDLARPAGCSSSW